MKLTLLVSLTALLATSWVAAEDLGMYTVTGEDGDSAMRVCPSIVLFEQAPQAYYKVFGEWPETFSAIVEAGLIRDNLTIDGVNILSPDDGVFNHPMDHLYVYRGPQTPPQIAMLAEVEMVDPELEDPDPPVHIDGLPEGAIATSLPSLSEWSVYARQARQIVDSAQSPDEIPAYTEKYGGNLAAHKLLAISNMCLFGASAYRSAYGEFPTHWDDIVDTGFCPVTSDMLNPATGLPFAGDGSAYSFEFRFLEDGSLAVSVHGDDGDYVRVW